MTRFLEEIGSLTRKRVDALKVQTPLPSVRDLARRAGPGRPFEGALRQSGRLAVIAELKQASPSAGAIRKEPDLTGRAIGYDRGGASAISVLTEEHYFHGSPQILEGVRRVTERPLLRKDFILDPYQVFESRGMGADAILLIVALVGGAQARDLRRHAEDAGMEALVEVHDERELDAALESGARMIGINNRNLNTLEVDLRTGERLAPRVPKDRTLVIESGIRDPHEMPAVKRWGAHAVLIGEALMREDDPEARVRQFVEAGAS